MRNRPNEKHYKHQPLGDKIQRIKKEKIRQEMRIEIAEMRKRSKALGLSLEEIRKIDKMN
jgi:hypothetical protein